MMKTKTLALLLTILIISSADAAKIVFSSPSAVKSGSVVTIGDVASVTGAGREEVERIARIEIGSAPLPGLSRTIDLRYVIVKLKSVLGDVSGLKIHGPDKLVVTSRFTTVKGEMLAASAREYLLSRLPLDGKRYEVEITRVPADIAVPEGQLELKLSTPSVSVNTGPRVVSVSILVDGRQKARAAVFADVKASAEVLVARSAITQKSPISESNTTWEIRDVTRVASPVTRSVELNELVATRSIQAGTVITTEMLAAPPAVETGSPVTIVVRSSSVRLSTRGTAAQSGKPGDIIRVKGPFGSGDVRAIVVEPGLVEVRI